MPRRRAPEARARPGQTGASKTGCSAWSSAFSVAGEAHRTGRHVAAVDPMEDRARREDRADGEGGDAAHDRPELPLLVNRRAFVDRLVLLRKLGLERRLLLRRFDRRVPGVVGVGCLQLILL